MSPIATARLFGGLAWVAPPAWAMWELHKFEQGEPVCGLPALGIILTAIFVACLLSVFAAALLLRAHRRAPQRKRFWVAEVAIAALPAIALPLLLLIGPEYS